MYSYIKALEKVIYELGGEIYTEAKVDKIVIEKGIAKGGASNNNIYKSDIVVCNAEYVYAVEELIGEDVNIYIDRTYKHSPSVFIIYLGVDKKYEKLKVHNHFLSRKFRSSIESFFMEKYVQIHQYISILQVELIQAWHHVVVNLLI